MGMIHDRLIAAIGNIRNRSVKTIRDRWNSLSGWAKVVGSSTTVGIVGIIGAVFAFPGFLNDVNHWCGGCIRSSVVQETGVVEDSGKRDRRVNGWVFVGVIDVTSWRFDGGPYLWPERLADYKPIAKLPEKEIFVEPGDEVVILAPREVFKDGHFWIDEFDGPFGVEWPADNFFGLNKSAAKTDLILGEGERYKVVDVKIWGSTSAAFTWVKLFGMQKSGRSSN